MELTRRYERGQAEFSEVQDQLKVETSQLIELQASLGFEYITDGGLASQDPLRPLARSLEGVSTGSRYSRWFDTNTFYQKPVITGKISSAAFSSQQFLQAQALPSGKKWKVSLPGPYSFSELSENHYYRSQADLLHDLATAEQEVINKLAKSGASLIQLSEPCLVYTPYREEPPSSKEFERALHALKIVSEGAPSQIQVHTFFGDAHTLLPRLLDLPLGGVGFDVYETELSGLNFKTSKTIALGIVDARQSHLEDPGWVAKTVAELARRVDAPDWVLVPNTDLRYLPREVADDKARVLGKAVDRYEEI